MHNPFPKGRAAPGQAGAAHDRQNMPMRHCLGVTCCCQDIVCACRQTAWGSAVYECRVTRNPDPRPAAGKDISVSAFVLPNTAPVGSVQLTYLVNYGTPSSIPMTAAAGMHTFPHQHFSSAFLGVSLSTALCLVKLMFPLVVHWCPRSSTLSLVLPFQYCFCRGKPIRCYYPQQRFQSWRFGSLACAGWPAF